MMDGFHDVRQCFSYCDVTIVFFFLYCSGFVGIRCFQYGIQIASCSFIFKKATSGSIGVFLVTVVVLVLYSELVKMFNLCKSYKKKCNFCCTSLFGFTGNCMIVINIRDSMLSYNRYRCSLSL